MLCAGVVHGDLSEFNILLGHADGVDAPRDH
jgi:RIO kinase 1